MPPLLSEYRGSCRGCSKEVLGMRGIYCANFWARRGPFPPCEGVWHGKCFQAAENDPFPIRVPVDEAGYKVIKTKDAGRFCQARDGDHLVTRFQCPLCHFRNIYGREPQVESETDKLMLQVYLPRAILDAFWSRESGTIGSNKFDTLHMIKTHKSLGMERNLPALGPLPLRDVDGVSLAVCFLVKSLDPGKNEKTVQYNTARGIRTSFNNLWNVSTHGQSQTVAVGGKSKMHSTSTPGMGDWFSRFDKGVHNRMGDVSIQDAVWTPELFGEIMSEFEKDWEELHQGEACQDMRLAESLLIFPALMGMIQYVLGLRGEECPLMDLYGTKVNTAKGMSHPTNPHGVVALLGRFKGETGELCHMMPIPVETDSGVKPLVWINRMLEYYDELGVSHGPVFRDKKGEVGKYGDYEFGFLQRIAAVQVRAPHLLPKADMDVFKEFGFYRSGRRSATSRALNVRMLESIIDANNRWRVREGAKGKDKSQNMRQHYGDVLAMLEVCLAFPQAM
jgi:hypothetical protein